MWMNKDQTESINFDDDWLCCYLRSIDDIIDETILTTTASIDEDHWATIQLPHIVADNERESGDTSTNTEYNWWYHKEFDWKSSHQKQRSERVYLIFEPHSDHDRRNDNAQSSIITGTVWLNKTKLFSGSLMSPPIPIELTEQLMYPEETKKNDRKNTLIVDCKKVSLFLHARLLVSRVQTDQTIKMTHSNWKRHHVLDYMVNFDDADGRINIVFDSNLTSPETSERQACPDILIDGEHAPGNSEVIMPTDGTNGDVENIKVPRLAIVIFTVGSRGDVQPFIALGKALRAVGHRVRLATHEPFRQFVREHDLEFYPLAGNPDDLISFVVKNSGLVPSVSSIIGGDVTKNLRDFAAILQSTWEACIADDDETAAPFTAEIIIANPPSLGHIHCAHKLRIPLHMMFTMPWTTTSVYPHPFCKVDYSKGSKEKINMFSYNFMEMLTWSSMRGIVNEFRKNTLDLSPLHMRQAMRMMVDECVPHTYCWSPSLVPKPFDWEPHIDISGFIFLDTDSTYTDPPADLVEFLGLHCDQKPPPPIYIGFGSITGHDSKRLFKVILEALNQTGYRALLSGFDNDNDDLPDNIFKVKDLPHEWLFQHVSAVCHHGGAGTTAAGLRAGKPTIIVPFFGDQFFWGNVVAKNGAGPTPLPGKDVTVDELVDAFKFSHRPETQAAAERISEAIAKEDGCATAVRMFHNHLPLSRMRSDLEQTYAACYRVDKYDIQVSQPVAQVLVATGALDESDFRSHSTYDWHSLYDHRIHIPTHGFIKHTHKAVSNIFTKTAGGLKRAGSSHNLLEGAESLVKGVGKGVGHMSLAFLSLYGEMTDVLSHVPTLYDRDSEVDAHKRPRVTDFQSGVKAAKLSVLHGWKDSINGFVTKPRAGYHKRGILGGASGMLVATANGFLKPTAGTLASATWLGRGTYASLKKSVRNHKTIHDHVDLVHVSSSSSFSMTTDEQQEHEEDDDVPRTIRFAAAVSGFSPDVCQQILVEFDQIKAQHEQMATPSPPERRPSAHRRRCPFRQERSHSDPGL